MGRRFSLGIHRHRAWQRGTATVTGVVLVLGLTTVPGSVAVAEPVAPAAASNGSVLVFHGAADAQKDPVARATAVLTEIGAQSGLAVDEAIDPAVFTPANLDRYRGVVFLSADGVTLSRDQEMALQGYIHAGGGFLGIANAAKAQTDSDWFTGLIGTRPVGARP